jgi:hypothetical protein
MTEIKKEIVIKFSGQAEDLLRHIPTIKKEDVVEWFTSVRKISIGGGDVLDYLHYKDAKG